MYDCFVLYLSNHKLVFRINWDAQGVYGIPMETTKAFDDFAVPKRCRREGAREASFVYSGNLRYYSIAVCFVFICHPA